MFDEIPGVDAAAGGEAGGGGDGGGTAVAEPPAGDGAAPAAGGEEVPGADADPDPSIEPGIERPAHEQQQEEELPELAGKNVDEKTRKAISDLKKINPELAKTAADSYFANQAVLKETGTKTVGEAISQIRQAKATIESLGGEDGIQTLQTENAQFKKEMDQFASGDKDLILDLWKESADKTAGMTMNSLEVIRDNDPKAFDNVIVPFLNERIRSAELPQSIETLLKFIEEGKGQEAYDLTQNIKKWMGGVDSFAKKVGEARKSSTAKSPEAQQLETERQQLSTERKQLFEGQLNSEVTRLNNVNISRIVDPFFREMKLLPEGRKDFLTGLHGKILAAMKGDPTFLRLSNALKVKGDVKATAAFVAQKYAEILPGMFEKHRNAGYPNYRAKAPVPGAKPGATNGKPAGTPAVPKVATAGVKPKHEDVSWASDGGKTSDVEWLTGKAWLKNGQYVTFVH